MTSSDPLASAGDLWAVSPGALRSDMAATGAPGSGKPVESHAPGAGLGSRGRPGRRDPRRGGRARSEASDVLTSLATSGEHHRSLFLESAEVMVVIDPATGRIVDANPAACTYYGFGHDRLAGLPLFEINVATVRDTLESLGRAAAGAQRTFTLRQRLASGEIRDVEATGSPIRVGGRTLVYAIVHDVSDHRLATRRITRLADLTRALATADGAIARAKTETEVHRCLCRIVVEQGGLAMAWLGLLEPGSGDVRVQASAGDQSNYLDDLGGIEPGVLEPGVLRPDDTVAAALRTGVPAALGDLAADPAIGGSARAALRRGYRSMASIPIRAGAVVVGVLQCFANEPDAFGPEELAILNQLASDASARLATIDRDRQRYDAEEALTLSEQRYRGLFEAAPLGIVVTQPGRFEVNDAFLAMFGYPDRTTLEQAGLEGIIAPQSGPAADAIRASLGPGNEGPTILRAVGRRYDGLTFPVLVEGTRLEFDGVGYGIVFVTDLSVLETAEAAARHTRGQYETLVDSAPLPIVSVDLGGVVRSWNPAAEQAFGWTAADVVGKLDPLPGLADRQDLERLRDLVFGPLPPARGLEVRRRRRDGSPVDLRAWASPLRDAAGEPSGVLVVLEDVTEHHRLELERARLAAAIDQASESIVITDPSATIVYVNPAFERLTGYPREQAIGRNPRLLQSGRQSASFYQAMWATLTAGETWRGSLVNRRADGTEFQEEAVISPVFDVGGKLANYIAVKRDVSRERELEADLETEARSQAAVVAALERLTPRGTPEATASAICQQMLTLPDVVTAGIMSFLPGDVVFSLAGLGPPGLMDVVGRPLIPERGRYLRARAEHGPWSETRISGAGPSGLGLVAAGIEAVAFAPIRGERGLLGLVAIGAAGPEAARSTSRYLSAVIEFAAVAGALLAPSLAGRLAEVEGAARVRSVIRDRAFSPVFQPIVDLDSGCVVGFEALTRFSDGTSPDVQFAEAQAVGLGLELERATAGTALAAAAALPPEAWLSINVSPQLAIDHAAIADLLAGTDRVVVLEITEHVAVSDYAELLDSVHRLGPAVWLAVDDAGAGFASLRHVVELRPDIVKLDICLVRSVDGDPARRALIAGMCHFAAEAGCRLVAEGIETEAERDTLRGLGVGLGQGFLLGRPNPIAPA